MAPPSRAVTAATAVALVTTLVGFGATRLPPADPGIGGSGGEAVVLPQQADRSVLGGVGRVLSIRGGAPAGRPARTPTFPEENRHTPPSPRVGPDYANGIVLDAPLLIGDAALPWRYMVNADLVGMVDEGAVRAGVAAWDDRPGSRWATAFDGYTTVDRAVADGRSVIFMERNCEGLTNANTYIFTDGGLGLDRYGARGTQVREADIGLCPRLRTPEEVERAVRHEVGHVVGLGHLCDVGDPCHRAEMGTQPHGCRTMYWQARACQGAIDDGDLSGLHALYATLRPLHGPTREQTVSRTSFAMFHDGEARTAVVVADDAPAGVAPAAAALAGRVGGTLLLGSPHPAHCLGGDARSEANRALARRGTLVLVGDWPGEACADMAHDWDLALRRVEAQDVVRAAVDLADLGPHGDDVVLAGVGRDPGGLAGDAIPAAALAGSYGAPLLLTDPAGLSQEATGWLRAAGTRRAVIVGGPGAVGSAVVEGLRGMGIEVHRVRGADRVDTALAVADLMRGAGARHVVVAAAGSAVDGLGAAVVAARRGAVVLLTPPVVDPRVTAWLARARPPQGWSVGGPAVLPPVVLSAYTRAVG